MASILMVEPVTKAVLWSARTSMPQSKEAAVEASAANLANALLKMEPKKKVRMVTGVEVEGPSRTVFYRRAGSWQEPNGV